MLRPMTPAASPTDNLVARPSGLWSVRRVEPDGHCSPALFDTDPVSPSHLYAVCVPTVCGLDAATVEAAPTEAAPAWLFARKIQLLASNQHSGRHGCAACHDHLVHRITLAERGLLPASDPTPGGVRGVGSRIES